MTSGKIFYTLESIKYIFEDSDDESSSDEEILSVMEYKMGNYTKTKQVRINLYMENVIFNYNDTQFKSHFRISRYCFEVLLGLIGTTLLRQSPIGRRTINPQKQLLAVLWLLATPDSFRYYIWFSFK